MSPKHQSTPIVPLLMVGLGLILIVGSIVWTLNAGRSTADDLARAAQNDNAGQNASDLPAQPATPRIPYPDISRVSVEEAKAALDQKQAVFIDVRGEPLYSDSHIPGAISMTDEDLRTRMGELDKNAWIITYCT